MAKSKLYEGFSVERLTTLQKLITGNGF